MWYQHPRPKPVQPQTRMQRFTLRILIFIGIGALALFWFTIFQEEVIGYRPLYYLLMVSMVYLGLRVLYEWYHYFSISFPTPPAPELESEAPYQVDVFTTHVPGEPYAMVLTTLEAIQAMDYPHTTYLCDEGDDPYLKEECQRLGVVHVTRERKINAKAGNINNALRQASGDICLILDPDHVPAPDFLDEVLPYFRDPEVGFVQVVQAYSNINQNLIAKGAAQQTFQFYGPMMMTMNRYGTVQAIGANCTFRRRALDSIGGHAAGLAEDMNTAMKLHARGWQSRYVPRVLSRGLVPNTISAYYKQQLKWSRGVMELLLTTFRENFGQFSLRQKLHYALIPAHYLGGLIYLITFMIPVFSLLLGVSPMRINLAYFLLMATPFFASTYAIRHYVQRWVMEEDERGNHFLGGFLLIGTWFIHSLGVIYTFLRRKVPYLPTPKDDYEEETFRPNIPNLAIAGISAGAIAVGLYREFNPYSLIMAGFASLNIGFMLLMLLVSYQNKFRLFKQQHPTLEELVRKLAVVKKHLWILRHRFYGLLRYLALPLMIAVIAVLYYWGSQPKLAQLEGAPVDPPATAHYLGWYLPQQEPGLTELSYSDSLSKQHELHPQIISLYQAWQPGPQEVFPIEYLRAIHQRNAYPLITWEPWLSTFPGDSSRGPVMQQIAAGKMDRYLERAAQALNRLEKPVFLRFAHEPDNPQYPWYSDEPQAGQHYRQAWRYIYRFMERRGLEHLIWVYSPWKAEAADLYFPGEDYVDWNAITALNYAAAVDTSYWATLADLYNPFRRKQSFQLGLPVMLAEMGSLPGRQSTEQWYKQALGKMQNDYPQIQACVLFGAAQDRNLPEGREGQPLNWSGQMGQFASLQSWQQEAPSPRQLPTRSSLELEQSSGSSQSSGNEEPYYAVHYSKGNDWKSSMHPLFRGEIRQDFRSLKSLGVEQVLRFGPTVYDHNIFRTAREENLSLIYGYWLEDDLDFRRDKPRLAQLRKQLLDLLQSHRDSSSPIAGWHLGNALWDKLQRRYPKPQWYLQREAFLEWLQGTTEAMRRLDQAPRPLSIALEYNAQLLSTLQRLAQRVPELDAVGIRFSGDRLPPTWDSLRSQSPLPLFILELPSQELPRASQHAQRGKGLVMGHWQDDEMAYSLITDGFLDFQGRYKKRFRLWTGQSSSLPPIAILPPARTPYPGIRQNFKALIKLEEKWLRGSRHRDTSSRQWHWKLIKRDRYGNPLGMEELGSGASISLPLPKQPERYLLQLQLQEGQQVQTVLQPLITPFYLGPDLREPTPQEADFLLKQSKY